MVSFLIFMMGVVSIWDLLLENVDHEDPDSPGVGGRFLGNSIDKDDPEWMRDGAANSYKVQLSEALLNHNNEAAEERLIAWHEQQAMASPRSTRQKRSYYFDFLHTYYNPPLCAQANPHPTGTDKPGFVDFVKWKEDYESYNPLQSLCNTCGVLVYPDPQRPLPRKSTTGNYQPPSGRNSSIQSRSNESVLSQSKLSEQVLF